MVETSGAMFVCFGQHPDSEFNQRLFFMTIKQDLLETARKR